MSIHASCELQLTALIQNDADCASLGIVASMGLFGGVLITCRGRALGLWLVSNDRLNFEHVVAKEARFAATDPQEAVRATLDLVRGEIRPGGDSTAPYPDLAA